MYLGEVLGYLVGLAFIGWILYNICYLIPEKQRKIEDKMILHFQEINIKLDRLEELIKEKNKKE